MSIIEYGTHKIDITKLPEKSVNALIARGLTHFLGNEQASKVAAKFKDVEGTTDEQRATAKAEYVALAVKALHEGTIGNRTGSGPRGTSVDSVMRGLAEAEVKGILKHNKLSMPSGDKVVKFADGTTLTRAQLIDRRIEKHGERLRKEAEAEIKREERETAKAGGVETLL